MSAPPKGLVVIHGHFYQPPRENPWTGLVDAERSAAPDHDWNVRITREAYEPLIPVYRQLSFDFGPTLLEWMEREAPAVYRAVLRSDHGNALASPDVDVRDLVIGSDLAFIDRGRHVLRGVPGEWTVLAVR